MILQTPYMAWIVRGILSLALIVSGLAKVFDPISFTSVLIYQYELPVTPSILIPSVLPFVEIAIGIILLVNFLSNYALASARILFSFFVIVHIILLFSDTPFSECYCYGTVLPMSLNASSILTVALALLSWFPVKNNFTAQEAKPNTPQPGLRKTIFANVFYTIVAVGLSITTVAYRYVSTEGELNQGLLRNFESDPIRNKVEKTLQPYVPRDTSKNLSTLVLFLTKSGCFPCQRELVFWNQYRFKGKFNVVPIFPQSKESGTLLQMQKMFSLKFPLHEMKDDQIQLLWGKHYPPVARVLLDENMRLALVSEGGVLDEDREIFLKRTHLIE